MYNVLFGRYAIPGNVLLQSFFLFFFVFLLGATIWSPSDYLDAEAHNVCTVMGMQGRDTKLTRSHGSLIA